MHNELDSATMPKVPHKNKKRKTLRYLLLILLILIASFGVWACIQMMEKGEVVIPMPTSIAEKVNDSLNLTGGKIGPIRFGTDSDHISDSSRVTSGPVEVSGMFLTNSNIDGKSADTLGINQDTGTLEDHITALAMPKEDELKLSEVAFTDSNKALPEISITEDNVITKSFVDDLAALLVNNYWPQGSHPAAAKRDITSLNIKSINQRYGVDLKGMAGSSNAATRDFYSDRNTILDYAFTASMVKALTHLYGTTFVNAVVNKSSEPIVVAGGQNRSFSKEDRANMLKLYAGQFNAVASTLKAYTETPQVRENLDKLKVATQNAYNINGRYLDALQRLESVQESTDVRIIKNARTEADNLANEYQKAMLNQKNITNTIITSMQEKGARLDGNSIIYIASWASRRASGDSSVFLNSAECLNQIANLMIQRASTLE